MRNLATIQRIDELQPIEGADRIERARVKGWWVVVKRGEFEVGSPCLYFEIDSFLPVLPEYEFLLRNSPPKTMTVDGVTREGIRLRTVKLRGQISQGLALRVPDDVNVVVGADVSDQLGVVKYEPQLPAPMGGEARGLFPSFIPKTDEERIQNIPDILSFHAPTGWYVTEKLDGTSVTMYKKDGVFGVCSRNLELKEGDSLYWRCAKQERLAEKLPDNVAIQGEIVGEGVQGNRLHQTGVQAYFFSMYSIFDGNYFGLGGLLGWCEGLGLRTVPVLDPFFSPPPKVDEMLEYARGTSALNGDALREGVVVRTWDETTYKGGRASFKAISNDYLLAYD